jgi:ABC-type transport system involved in multi-copper enzyme maturation permease subunit
MDVASEEFWKSRDLPQRLGPMTVKELRQGLRRGSFVYPFLAIHLLAIIAMAAEFQMTDEVEGTTDYIGSLNLLLFLPGVDVSSGPFWAVVGAICLVLMPLGGLALMGQELEDGNHELLLMTPLSRWKVVRGKFLALWGLCLMTFVSLLPYMIVRYLIGGIDPVRNIFMAVTVVVFSAMMTAGGIGASSFTGIVARIATLILFTGSMLLSLLFVGWGSAWRSEEAGFHPAGVIYHLNAFSAAFCYIVLGLALARSRIRLVVHHYEVKPSWMIIGLLLFTPFVAGMAALFTVGFAGGVGLIGMGLVAWFADTSPKAPKWVQAPAPNVPPLPPTAAALPVEGEAGLPVDPPQVDEGLSKLEEAKEPSESEEP